MNDGVKSYAIETYGLVKEFAGFRAVDGVDLRLEAGWVHALVGPNGAGKTSLFNLLTGFLRPTAGRITLFGEDATGLAPEHIARRGVARSFQITSLFEQLTALEHVALALQAGSPLGFRFWRSERALERFHGRARELLDAVGIADLAARRAGGLPYGQRSTSSSASAAAGPYCWSSTTWASSRSSRTRSSCCSRAASSPRAHMRRCARIPPSSRRI